MTKMIECVVEDLKELRPERISEVAQLVHGFAEEAKRDRRKAALEATCGIMSEDEANEWEAAIAECRKVDNEGW